jgi:hypothetical protein
MTAHRVLLLLLAPVLALAGCGEVGFEKVGGPRGAQLDTGGLRAPVSITAVDPATGSLDGGELVELSGWGFEGEVGVRFGATPATITVASDTLIYAEVPPAAAPLSVDIVVESDLGDATLSAAFTYVEDGSGDDGGDEGADGSDGSDGTDGSDGGDDLTGLTVGHAALDYFVVGCPGCFGASSNLLIDATATFHAPAAVDWHHYLPAPGSCISNASRTPPSVSARDVGSAAWLHGPSSSPFVPMGRTTIDGLTAYEATGLDASVYVKSTALDVEDGSGQFTADVVQTVSRGFDTIEPLAIFNDGTSAYTPWSVSADRFVWAPTGIADAVVIRFDIFRSSTFVGDILCRADDTGSFQPPASLFASYYVGDVAAVWIYRLQLSAPVNPDDGSIFSGSSSFGGVGTVTLQP